MTEVWVDTDFGFDDLWALLLLRHLGCDVAGVSLVAGNAPLPQVVANAVAAKAAYGFDWPLWQGTSRPLVRTAETAVRILGPTGMRSRGRQLDPTGRALPPEGAVQALAAWLGAHPSTQKNILALGPMTNIAHLLKDFPDLSRRISRLVWMGGSAGAGNHTPHAEYNAFADAEALDIVVNAGVPLDVVDLTFCRKVTFGADDLPDSDPLTLDLLGGYLDIGLERGRPGMAIYDPLAALALARPETTIFDPCTLSVETGDSDTYGATRIADASRSRTRVSVEATADLARLCLDALKREAAHGD
ncbi:MAG: nucleoside hydrolase [Pseudomonadota bacterium]